MTDNKDRLPSLRTRYITLTVLLGLLVIAIAALFYRNVLATKSDVTNELVEITAHSNQLNKVRANLAELHSSVDSFLLDPTSGDYQEKINRLIRNSAMTVADLNAALWREERQLIALSEKLESDFIRLQKGIDTLVSSRMSISQQYPGMAISASQMTGPQHVIASKLQLLIDEIESGELVPESTKLYPLLLKSYTLWVQQISQMRIYLANRFASFNGDILVDQAASLRDFHEKFVRNIDELTLLYQKEDSFEGEASIEVIKASAVSWMAAFGEVRAINESEYWRSDTHLMRTTIIPLTEEISASLKSMEKRLKAKESDVVDKLRKNSEMLSVLLFTIIVMFLLFITAILFSMNMLIFRPISCVVSALKSKAFDVELPQLMSAKHREIGALVESFREMDMQVNQRQNALEHQALHDHLTGIPNRFMLNQRLEYQLLTAEEESRSFSLLLMDLDNFKDVNDSLGHAAGDLLLIEVAARLTKCVSKVDTVARLGGDEFAILLPEMDKDKAAQLIKRLAGKITEPFEIKGQSLSVGISVGVVSYPEDGTTAVALLQHADMAMYIAKRNRSIYSCYDAKDDYYTANRLSLVNDLRYAMEHNELELYYQPQFDINANRVSGAEALLRWKHREHGFINPEQIVELAEYAGLIHQLSIWVMHRAIAQCHLWHRYGEFISVAVNLSVYDLSNPDLCEETEKLLALYQLPSQFLTLEITESGMMENPARSIEVLKTLSDMGINLSVDDFGTGFSSLAYLKQLPVNELKIDKSFVMNIDSEESDAVIVQSTINLGHNLGLKVVAEGVETQTHLDVTKGFGCDMAQGYLFSKPRSSDDFMKWLGEVSDNSIKRA